MYKLIIGLLLLTSMAKAQTPLTFTSVDSLTYQYYLQGDWDKLQTTADKAIYQGIDYKRLRQRMGYAYFVKGDYYAAQKQYDKALAFDESDADTKAYLYYCSAYNGDEVASRVYASQLSVEAQNYLNLKPYKWLDAVDLEYNFKANNVNTRSNPTYMRIGLNSQLGYRWSLYQSVSTYTQYVDNELTKQPDYFASLSYSVNTSTALNVGYHYLNTSVAGVKSPSNMVYGELSTKINRFHVSINGSIMKTVSNTDTTSHSSLTKQFGIQAGVSLPGAQHIYLNSSFTRLQQPGNKRYIFGQSIGGQVSKKLWMDGNIIFGDLTNYNDNKGLYIYNSGDATKFRTGFTLFYNLNSKISLIGNYTFDQKQIINTNTTTNYYQQSFSGGIKWKL